MPDSSIKHCMKPRNTQSGLTLIELLVAMAVFAILVAIAAPNFTSFTSSNKTTGEANALASAMTYARSEAITRNAPITIIANTAGAQSWSNGWALGPCTTFNAGICTAVSALKQSGAMPASFTVTTTVNTVTFNNDGSTAIAAPINTFKICDANYTGTGTGKTVIVSRTGPVSLILDDCP